MDWLQCTMELARATKVAPKLQNCIMRIGVTISVAAVRAKSYYRILKRSVAILHSTRHAQGGHTRVQVLETCKYYQRFNLDCAQSCGNVPVCEPNQAMQCPLQCQSFASTCISPSLSPMMDSRDGSAQNGLSHCDLDLPKALMDLPRTASVTAPEIMDLPVT